MLHTTGGTMGLKEEEEEGEEEDETNAEKRRLALAMARPLLTYLILLDAYVVGFKPMGGGEGGGGRLYDDDQKNTRVCEAIAEDFEKQRGGQGEDEGALFRRLTRSSGGGGGEGEEDKGEKENMDESERDEGGGGEEDVVRLVEWGRNCIF
eukprot:evm.model.NODE_35788_length_2030_cov_24.016256.1